jgi:alkaline phosphatase D
MRKLTTLFVALTLVVAMVYGCDESRTTEPEEVTADATIALPNLGGIFASTFDTDADGWTLVGDAEGQIGDGGEYRLQPYYSPSIGNPGGAVYAVDIGKGMPWFWQAPPKFLGNRFIFFGRTLEFDLKVFGAGSNFNTADVILAGAGLTLVTEVTPDPGPEWTSYSVDLKEGGGWRVGNIWNGRYATNGEILQVLSNLSALRIRGEHLGDVGDTGCLDNVRIRLFGPRD